MASGLLQGCVGFGQSEPLTSRLRNILSQYAAGCTTLYELVQNADDAGATTVRFIASRKRSLHAHHHHHSPDHAFAYC